MKRILCAGLLWTTLGCPLGWAQGPPKEAQALVEVKYADVNRLANLLAPTFGANLRAEPSLHVIAVRGLQENVDATVAAIKKLDVPMARDPDVELTIYLMVGDARGQVDSDVPQDLAATVKQLHGLFTFKSYRLADTLMLRGRAVGPGENPFRGANTEAEGVLPGSVDLHYHFSYYTLNVSSETPRAIHINSLQFNISGPSVTTTVKDGTKTTTAQQTKIATDLDIREGQKTVVGKSSLNGAGDALILVIVPKVIE